MPRIRPRCLRGLFVGSVTVVLPVIAPAVAWAEDPLTLDFVRHGESGDMSVINTQVPGPPLTLTGEDQATKIAGVLEGKDIDQIFASTMIRSQETADPLARALEQFPLNSDHLLSGLNEINAGIFEGAPVNVGDLPLGGAEYLLAPALWTLGLYFVPELGSSDANGAVFEDRVNDAVQTIYDLSAGNGDSNITDAVFSHEGTIAIWTLMNVDNPDFQVVLNELLTTGELLPYTGTVEVKGDPQDGWTLVSWDGHDVPQDPGLPTELFVDFRDLITAPQMAAYHIYEALLGGDPATIEGAIQAGISQVDTATAQFPVAVLDDLVGALAGGVQNLDADLTSLLPAAATDAAALLPGDLGALVGAAVAAF